MATRFVIGVDGGGTGCRVLVKDMATGHETTGEAGPANVATDFAQAIANVKSAIAKAAGSRDISDATAHIGLAGVYNATIAEATKDQFSFKVVSVSDDRDGAVEGVLGAQEGFLVAAGTGMILASSKSGVQTYVGGRGFQISDHGSGAWIGREILDLTLRCVDGIRTHSDLTKAVWQQFDADAHEIVAFSLRSSPADYASLAPLVIEAARAGDRHGETIMETGAREITDGLTALGFRPGARLCLAGGVGPHYVSYLDTELTAGLVMPEGTALEGAVRIAQRLRDQSDR